MDQVLNRDEINDYLVEVVGASNDDGLYEAFPFESYVARKRPSALLPVEGERVAVITAEGEILPGEQPSGSVITSYSIHYTKLYERHWQGPTMCPMSSSRPARTWWWAAPDT